MLSNENKLSFTKENLLGDSYSFKLIKESDQLFASWYQIKY